MDIWMGGAVRVKHGNYLLLQLTNLILKGLPVSIKEARKILIVSGLDQFVLRNCV